MYEITPMFFRFFFCEKLTFNVSFTRPSVFFPTFNRPLQFPQSSNVLCAFYPFFRSQRQRGQQLMFQTNIETKKRAFVYLWCCIVRSLTLGRLFEQGGEPSTVPRNPQWVGVHNYTTVSERELYVCNKKCVWKHMCVCTIVYLHNMCMWLVHSITQPTVQSESHPVSSRK